MSPQLDPDACDGSRIRPAPRQFRAEEVRGDALHECESLVERQQECLGMFRHPALPRFSRNEEELEMAGRRHDPDRRRGIPLHTSGRRQETTTPGGSTASTPAGDTVRRINWPVSGSGDSISAVSPRSSGCSKVSGAHHAHNLRPLTVSWWGVGVTESPVKPWIRPSSSAWTKGSVPNLS